MTAMEQASLTVDGMNEGGRYWIAWCCPLAGGKIQASGEFLDVFLRLQLGIGQQLYAHFARQEAIDVRHIIGISKAD